MKILILSLALVLSWAPGAGAARTFTAEINGAQNVPALPEVTATGIATLVLNDAETEVTYHIEYTGLSSPETGAHIHNAGPRDIGPIVFVLPAGSPKDGVWQITATDLYNLANKRLYINIHTVDYDGGEIRGNIVEQLTPAQPTTWGRVKALYPLP